MNGRINKIATIKYFRKTVSLPISHVDFIDLETNRSTYNLNDFNLALFYQQVAMSSSCCLFKR